MNFGQIGPSQVRSSLYFNINVFREGESSLTNVKKRQRSFSRDDLLSRINPTSPNIENLNVPSVIVVLY
jgi:hypothetical protein